MLILHCITEHFTLAFCLLHSAFVVLVLFIPWGSLDSITPLLTLLYFMKVGIGHFLQSLEMPIFLKCEQELDRQVFFFYLFFYFAFLGHFNVTEVFLNVYCEKNQLCVARLWLCSTVPRQNLVLVPCGILFAKVPSLLLVCVNSSGCIS